jgi:hypothetical protein
MHGQQNIKFAVSVLAALTADDVFVAVMGRQFRSIYHIILFLVCSDILNSDLIVKHSMFFLSRTADDDVTIIVRIVTSETSRSGSPLINTSGCQ